MCGMELLRTVPALRRANKQNTTRLHLDNGDQAANEFLACSCQTNCGQKAANELKFDILALGAYVLSSPPPHVYIRSAC